jgi:hypothetical protein
MDAKETKPETQEPKSERARIELIQIIYRRAKQARQILEIEAQRLKQTEASKPEPSPHYGNAQECTNTRRLQE